VILRVTDLRKSYPQGGSRLEILKGVSLEIEKPETVAIMGRSGCGKSTFISLVAGLDTPDSGEIEVLDRSLSRLPGRELNSFRAKHIGIVFQRFHLLEHLTALENARLPLDLNRVAGADARTEHVLRQVGLGHRLEHFPDQLSRGECQRVAIARVLVMKPELILADEPTGSLDAATGREVIELILSLARQEGFALLMATHDPSIAALCQRRLQMNEGVFA
jgi:putative ABC transport system ATP-binding protein